MRTTAACVMRGVLLVAAASCALATTGRPLGVVVQTQEAEALTVAADMRAVFDQWRATFGKAYSQGEQELEARFRVFRDNYAYVEEYNARSSSHKLSMNAFADLTAEEFGRHRLGLSLSTGLLHQTLSATPEPFPYAHVEPPASVDWRTLGAVTPIKDQSQCGSCWAFSTTGSVEGAHAVTNKQLVSLSEQELLDCDRAGGDRGCSGGLMDYAFDFIIKNGGIDTESDYPYHASDGACDASKRDGSKAVVVKSFVDVPPNNETALMQAVAMQPVAVALAASGLPFQLYKSGVFDGPCSTQLDHGMLAVGFGVDDETGKPYWLLKNSWGTVWGDSGYMKLAMGAPGAEGLCGVAMLPSFPLVDKAKPGPPPGPRPGPGPAPAVICDARTTCPANSTCCCTLSVFGRCLIKGCCPFPQATCCDDSTHCCPSTHPTCDLDAGVCSGNGGAVHALGTKFAATTEWLPFGRAQKGNEGAAVSVAR